MYLVIPAEASAVEGAAVSVISIGKMCIRDRNNPELQRAETELAGMRSELAKLEHSNAAAGNGNLAIPARQMPEAELEYLRRCV